MALLMIPVSISVERNIKKIKHKLIHKYSHLLRFVYISVFHIALLIIVIFLQLKKKAQENKTCSRVQVIIIM